MADLGAHRLLTLVRMIRQRQHREILEKRAALGVPVQERGAIQRFFYSRLVYGNVPDSQNQKTANGTYKRKKNKGSHKF